MFYSQVHMCSCVSDYCEVVRRENNLDPLAIQNLMTRNKEMQK